ncbi:hypothetical protein GCM10008937_10530 [Deinococcus depolymerans]|uniref:Uncharacterized protein n=1 Tax=Deinococcus depolymerans TaxID=392408 RepID=A0ABN1BSX6_9DEIO
MFTATGDAFAYRSTVTSPWAVFRTARYVRAGLMVMGGGAGNDRTGPSDRNGIASNDTGAGGAFCGAGAAGAADCDAAGAQAESRTPSRATQDRTR